MNRYPFPIPFGWFQVCWDAELGDDALPRHYFGRDLQVTRCDRGATVTDLASHRPMPTVVRNGLVMCWFHPHGDAPKWDIPSLPELDAHPNYSTPVCKHYRINALWQEMAETAADVAHIQQHLLRYEAQLNGGTRPDRVSAPSVDATGWEGWHSYMRLSQGFPTPKGVVQGRIDTDSFGPGFSTTWFRGLVNTLLIGCNVPVDEQRTEIRFTFLVERVGDDAATDGLAKAFVEEIDAQTVEDVPVWENKAYLSRPALARGDGPIMGFRRWAAQFYAEPGPSSADRDAAEGSQLTPT